jgi:hypothetical protein
MSTGVFVFVSNDILTPDSLVLLLLILMNLRSTSNPQISSAPFVLLVGSKNPSKCEILVEVLKHDANW